MSQKRSADNGHAQPSQQLQNKKRRSQAVEKSNANPLDANGLSECFKTVKTTMYVSLAPTYLNAPIAGIKSQHLDPLIMKYSTELNSVVLGYTDVLISDNHAENEEGGAASVLAKVNAHSPFAFLWIEVTFLVWKPTVGDVVEGLIYMQSPSHIGLLIHDTFNASIKKFNIPDDWSFIPNQADENDEEAAEAAEADAVSSRGRNNILGQWVDANQVPIDGKLKVTVKAVHTGSKVVSLEGTLIRPEEEISSFPVVPGGKKTKFDDDDVVPEVTKVLDDPTTVPGYESGSDGDVVAQDDSSEDDDDDSDSD